MIGSWRHRLESLPWTPPDDPGGRVLVLSAHPDDEVLAVGGWLAGQTERDVTFVTATDGEASHPRSTAVSPDELRKRRPDELLHALRVLGFGDPEVHRLGLPDGGLADVRDRLRDELADHVRRADLVLAPFEQDGHIDHDTLGAVAVELCGTRTPVWRFPIWTWAWTEPADQPWLPRLRRLECTSSSRFRKRRATAEFHTQIASLGDTEEPVVEPALLAHAHLAPEVVIV